MSLLRRVIAAVLWLIVPALNAQVVISQLYGGGGNAGATLRNDFIELFNRGNKPITVSGWSVQYAAASGNTWDRTILSGTIQPGQYYLIQEDQGNDGFSSLPTPEATGGINLSATSGKVALVSSSTVLSGAAPTGADVIDFVAYGSANAFEGSPADALTNTTALIRHGSGCADTNNNRADFAAGPPNPRNSGSPVSPCVPLPTGPQITAAGVTNAASFLRGPVAPGEMITIFGTGLGPAELVHLQVTTDRLSVTTSLAGTRVLFDGIPAPIIYTSATQASAVVPYSVGQRPTTELQVEYNGTGGNIVTLGTAASAPGIFTIGSSGSGWGAILNQDYTVNGRSNPAVKGSVVMIYATGGGHTVPDGEDGRIVGDRPPALRNTATVRIGGVDAPVTYAGSAPYMVSGIIQINAKIPEDLPTSGTVSIVVTIGTGKSQPGVTLTVAGQNTSPEDGTGPEIEDKLRRLKSDPAVAPLPELTTDRSNIPADWLALVSWNIQTGGTSTAGNAPRPPLVQAALSGLLSGTYQILAAQEIPSADNAALLTTMLPGGAATWKASFFDSTDSMDNGFWYRTGITLGDSFLLLTTTQMDGGRVVSDPGKALHPPQVAYFQVGDFDFTLINVHLTFAEGDTAESARELGNVLDYLDWYFSQPDHDPDVVVCGDFNTPSLLSGQAGKYGITLDSIFDQDRRFQVGERRFVVTVHQATSRSPAANGGAPLNNYDHCVLSADTMEEFVQARRVDINVLTDHSQDPEVQLTSDHFPVVALFRIHGQGIALDSHKTIRPTWTLGATEPSQER